MSTINRLSSVDALQPGDLIPVWDGSNGDTRKASLTTLLAFIESNFADPDYSTRIVAPAVDYFNVDIGATGDSIWMIINPTLNFTNGAVTLPPASSAVNDQEITMVFTASVSTFVITSAGATVIGTPVQINGYDSFRVRYNAAQQTWYNIGTTGSGSGSGVSQIVRQDFTGDGTTTTFTLTTAPSGLGNELQIFIDGVYQERAGYTVTGSNVVFSEAPPSLSIIEVLGWSVTLGAETSANLVSYTPAGTGAVLTTVQAKLRESVSVKDFGAVGDGVTDDTAAIQAAINASPKELYFPKGEYLCLTGLIIGSPVTLVGEGNQGAANVNVEGAKIVTSQNITLITFNGSAGNNQGSGGGIRDLALVQTNVGASNQGTAVSITGTTSALRANWVRIQNCQIENYSGCDTWSKGIVMDGTPVGGVAGIRDMWITGGRIVAANNAIEALNVFNLFIDNVECNITGSDIVISGTAGNESASVYFTNCSGLNLEIDYASNVYASGGAFVTATTTANSSSVNLNLGALTTVPSPVLGSNVYVTARDSVTGPIVSTSSEQTTHVFGRDRGAGDSTNLTQVQVGNFGANEGALFLRYTNDAAAGGPVAGLYALPRNNADTSNFNGGSLYWEKIGTLSQTNVVFTNSENCGVKFDGLTPGVDLRVSNNTQLRVDVDTTAGNTRLLVWDVDNNTLERVSVGAADSGGVGYKVLRIPN